jgi:PAS domain S-box-containing protein
MMRFYFQKEVLFGFIAALGIVTWLGISSYMNSVKFKKTLEWIAHTNEVMFHGERVLAIIIDIESGHRGFIITRDSSFLQPYFSGQSVIQAHLEHLRLLTADNENQTKRIDTLTAAIREEIRFIKSSIVDEGRSDEEDLAATEQGRTLMNKIRLLLSDLQQEEKNLLQQRTSLSEQDMLKFYYAFVALIIATAVILVLLFVSLNANLRKRIEADKSLRIAMAQVKDMYDNAPCGYHSLDREGYFREINKTELNLLGYTYDEVVGKMKFQDILIKEEQPKFEGSFPRAQVNGTAQDVETRVVRKDGSSFPVILSASVVYDTHGSFVKTRSMMFDYTERRQAEDKIIQLNHELEAFTYSVSHDLRAPLRSIDGYARILSEDYAQQLDQEGQRVLGIVVRNASRMGRLIDDLLDFSRVGRKEITKSNYNPEVLIKSVYEELKDGEKDRDIDFKTGTIHAAYSDPALMRQVWVNLISNALKYARKKDKTLVEITSQIQGKEVIYCVRDNGTGFDMQYAHKLFNVFQRLHKSQEFEGTGVGLAIVQRIVSRHGGRVWAESTIDNGAAFYFTLPLEQNT